MQARLKTTATRKALKIILRREFAGSQAAFSRRCGLDVAETSRAFSSVRPVSVRFVCRAIAALDEPAAAKVAEAFLLDVLAVYPRRYAMTLRPCARAPRAKPTRMP